MKSIILNIGDQDRIFYFGLGFLGILLEETNTNMVDFDEKRLANPFKWIPLMMFHSCAWGFVRENKSVDFTLQNMIEWIDDTDVETLQKFNEAFINSLMKNVPIDTDSKKKVNKK
jgi:hypothetical protein